MSFSFIAFVLLPVAELVLFSMVSRAFGGWSYVFMPTLLTTMIGMAAIRLARLRRPADRSVSERMAVPLAFLGGILLVIPGFITDALGLLLQFKLGRRLVWSIFRRRVQDRGLGAAPFPLNLILLSILGPDAFSGGKDEKFQEGSDAPNGSNGGSARGYSFWTFRGPNGTWTGNAWNSGDSDSDGFDDTDEPGFGQDAQPPSRTCTGHAVGDDDGDIIDVDFTVRKD